MKYRIKITTYANGRKTYTASVKKGWFWFGLHFDGSYDIGKGHDWDERATALGCIDKNYAGNSTRQTIEFEYITKP